MNQKIRCGQCRRLVPANRRVKDQRFCGRKECQRARKNLWQRQKLASDPDYQANQRDCFRNWYKRHPGYWRQYRRRNPNYCERNCLLQRVRDKKRRSQDLAKMDALKPIYFVKPGTYYLIAEGSQPLAKMDASAQKVIVIPIG
jgi:hypothetical protein